MREKSFSMREKWSLMKQYKAAYLLLAPFMLIFFIFTVLPVLVSIVLSFTQYNVLQTPKFVGFANYRNLLVNDEVFKIALKNTIIFHWLQDRWAMPCPSSPPGPSMISTATLKDF